MLTSHSLTYLLIYLHDCLGKARVGVAGFVFLRHEARQSGLGTGIRHRTAEAATRSIECVGQRGVGAVQRGIQKLDVQVG